MSVSSVNKQNGSLNLIASRGQFIQYSVMPTPSVDILNKIVQYIGTTTANYTNGYFYKCEETSTNVYGWVNVNVQAGGGGSAEIIKGYFNPSDNLFYEESTYVTPIAGDVNSLYLSLDTNLLYRYNGTIFVEVSNYEVGDGLNLDSNTLSADTVIFTGTSTEWNSVVDKSKYDIVNLTDEATGEVVNVVEDGNLNPVTSNAVYDGLSLKANTTAITNPNLFDNPWFTINQRGFTTKTFSAQQWDYSVDRWRIISSSSAGNSTVTLNNNNTITISNDDNQGQTYFEQLFENGTFEDGVNYTLSIMLSDGTILKGTNTMPTGNTGDTVKTFITFENGSFYIYHPNNGYYYVTINRSSGSMTIKAIKLEKGSISTLAIDTMPNYATELVKCQRYFRTIPTSEMVARINNGGNRIRFMSFYSENMRNNNLTASINYDSLTHQLYVNGEGSEILLDDTTDYTISYESNSRSIVLILTSSGQTKVASLKNNIVGIWRYGSTDNAPRIHISADL